MKRSAVVDEYGCELTAEEKKEIDSKAEEITENIFGDKVADQAAGVTVKKRPGRPKKDPQTLHENDQNEVKAPEDSQRGPAVIPDEVLNAVKEKITIITRTIENYEEQIEELKSDCQRNIELFEGYKKESQEKQKVLRDFLEGAKHGQI